MLVGGGSVKNMHLTITKSFLIRFFVLWTFQFSKLLSNLTEEKTNFAKIQHLGNISLVK